MKDLFYDAIFTLIATDKKVLTMSKARIFSSLIWYTITYKLIKSGWRKSPKRVSIFGYKYAIGDYGVFYGIFIDLFIRSEYSVRISKKKPVIVDFGSHIGMSILYFKILYPEAVVTGVEPDKKTYALLKKNMATNFPDVVIYNKAVAAKAGKLKLYAEGIEADWGNSNVKWKENTSAIEVDAIRASDLINKPVDILKIDIEGAEYEVFKELADTKKLPLAGKIIFEYHQFTGVQRATLDMILAIFRENNFIYFIDYHLGRSARKFSSMDLAQMYGSVYSNLVYAVREHAAKSHIDRSR